VRNDTHWAFLEFVWEALAQGEEAGLKKITRQRRIAVGARRKPMR